MSVGNYYEVPEIRNDSCFGCALVHLDGEADLCSRYRSQCIANHTILKEGSTEAQRYFRKDSNNG